MSNTISSRKNQFSIQLLEDIINWNSCLRLYKVLKSFVDRRFVLATFFDLTESFWYFQLPYSFSKVIPLRYYRDSTCLVRLVFFIPYTLYNFNNRNTDHKLRRRSSLLHFRRLFKKYLTLQTLEMTNIRKWVTKTYFEFWKDTVYNFSQEHRQACYSTSRYDHRCSNQKSYAN